MHCFAPTLIIIIVWTDVVLGWSAKALHQSTKMKKARNLVLQPVSGKRLTSIKLIRKSPNTFVATAHFSHRRRLIVAHCQGGRGNNTLFYTNKEGAIDFSGPSSMLVRIGKTKYKFPKEEATFSEAKKFCNKENMDVAALNNPDEVSKISEYLQYIGLSDNPVFASLSSNQSTPLSNWGQDAPPGGEGTCLVQQNGALYNASCDQKAYFACEERPLPNGVTTTIGPESLSSLGDAVLSFVGGKNILVPSEKANAKEAESMCANQGLQLMSLDSMAQMDSVQDFLGDIGKKF
ncbi:macrophage mannose receptor 1-like [Neocloeon triangulifer]|uniref:macrophage mannose receptor 1-like n=1 Tax=Neocloeon triangulifer TaxID=2078957 RepID=UPI00286EE88E|nr:macrophage mannose receptor 1-like [Neocloeon triangulifer]